ncbi:hypothetical protein TrST_g2747 [Triparma strigata]|uniref:Uncharacterized protein n=1 Tax=Triparma strigata TaxID=1606541 RepID=A0A9W7BT21_9STRA|nr:hypothetical protein TrST_g2747 [Triparma strigata]
MARPFPLHLPRRLLQLILLLLLPFFSCASLFASSGNWTMTPHNSKDLSGSSLVGSLPGSASQVHLIKAFESCGTDEYYTQRHYDSRALAAPLKRFQVTQEMCHVMLKNPKAAKDTPALTQYANATLFVTFLELSTTCRIGVALGYFEAVYLALSRAGAKGLILSAAEAVPGLYSLTKDPWPWYDDYWAAEFDKMPFAEIGARAGEDLLRRMEDVPDEELHVQFEFDLNKHEVLYKKYFSSLFELIVLPIAALTLKRIADIGIDTRKMTTRNMVAALELPAALAVIYNVVAGSNFVNPGSSGLRFLLLGHLFPFGGLASSILVTSFWKAYCEQYNDLMKFVDPVEAYPRWSKGVAFGGVFLDFLYPFMQVGSSAFQIADPVAIREAFYAPMILSYFIIMIRFVYTAFIAYRTVDSVASRKTMGIYLGFSTLFVGSSMGAFFYLSSLKYGDAALNWQVSMFLMYFGRSGLSLCDISIFTRDSSSSSTHSYSSGDEEKGLTEANPESYLWRENPAGNFLAAENSRVKRCIIERDQAIARLEAEKIKSFALFEIEKNAAAYQKQLVENEKNFIARALHEIRNPLNGIGLSLEHIFVSLTPKLDEEVEIELRTIESCCSHLSVLLKSVLSLDKLLNGALALPEEAFNPGVILGEVEKMNKHAAGAGVRVCHVGAGEKEFEFAVEGAPTQLSLVMINLVNNAAKFTEKGEITFGCNIIEESDEFVVLKFFVQDTGLGIPPEKQKFIFGFREQTGTTDSQSKGYGIGLNVSNRFVELMGGELLVRSPVRHADSFGGIGCEFSFTIKMKKIKNHVRLSQDTDGRDMSDANLYGLRVLVVDDSAVNRKMLVRKFTTGIFNDLSFNAESVKTGEEALERIREPGVQYDLVIMDENFEEAGGILTGTETTKAIRGMEKKRGPSRCLIFGCSGNCMEEDERRSKASGQDILWPKPAPGNDESLNDIREHWLLRLAREKELRLRLERETAANLIVGSETNSNTHGETETNSEAEQIASDVGAGTGPKANRDKGSIFSTVKVVPF